MSSTTAASAQLIRCTGCEMLSRATALQAGQVARCRAREEVRDEARNEARVVGEVFDARVASENDELLTSLLPSVSGEAPALEVDAGMLYGS